MLTVALVRDVFPSATTGLTARLREARGRGASLAMLPEMPLNEWCPALPEPRDQDAEAPDGPRHRAMADAARDAGIALLGGVILRDGQGRRRNRSLLFDESGACVATYEKLHLPDEPGFWETRHYEPATDPPRVASLHGFPLGIQVCSDVNRPQGTHLLAAMGAEAILAPRATEAGTFDRWRLMLRANAMAACAYVLSVPRPTPEHDVPLGGPSIAIDPNGTVLLETEDAVAVVTLDRAVVARARKAYPGYLAVRADVYAAGWAAASSTGEPVG